MRSGVALLAQKGGCGQVGDRFGAACHCRWSRPPLGVPSAARRPPPGGRSPEFRDYALTSSVDFEDAAVGPTPAGILYSQRARLVYSMPQFRDTPICPATWQAKLSQHLQQSVHGFLLFTRPCSVCL
ncbi:hypothetical protein MRX96_005314 [Rhipicephalus microplus]